MIDIIHERVYYLDMTVEELKSRKKKLKITTSELARMADVPNGTLSKILTGETKNPSHATMEKLERVLMQEEMDGRLMAYHDAMLRKDTRITVDDIVMKSGGRDKELVDGKVITCDMPGLAHQDMVESIGEKIRSFIKENGGDCKVYVAGLNVYLDDDEYTLVIPDVVVVCDREKLKEKGLYGAPDWVIEVVSPSTREVDYHKKLYKYMNAGVREYWIVDIEREMVSVCINGEPMNVTIYHFGEEIPVELCDRKLTIWSNEKLNST